LFRFEIVKAADESISRQALYQADISLKEEQQQTLPNCCSSFTQQLPSHSIVDYLASCLPLKRKKKVACLGLLLLLTRINFWFGSAMKPAIR
jgi:hypothetical protein